MRKFSANKSVKIVSAILSVICFSLLFMTLYGIIFLSSLGAYTNSYESVKMSYITKISPSDYTASDYSAVIEHYRNGTLNKYTNSTGNLYTIKIADRVLETNYSKNAASNNSYYYISFTDSVPLYNESGDFLVEYDVTIHTAVTSLEQLNLFVKLYNHRYTLIECCVIAFLILAIAVFLLVYGAGHKNDSDTVVLRKLDNIPFARQTTYLFAAILLVAILFIFFKLILDKYSLSKFIIYCILLTSSFLLILNWFISLRILSRYNKVSARSFLYDNIKKILHSFSTGLKYLPIIWKTIIALTLWFALEFWIIITCHDSPITLITLFILTKIVVVSFTISIALIMQKFKNAGKNISNGDLNFRLYTNSMWGEFAEFGETLNNIGYGMNKALKDRMESELKSEHFKTELITNVSHDIKTPLTSIINYVDLIKKEEPENDNINQYVNVLDRQSSRLKKLLEDLIEASKALTGNLKVELVPCELNVLLAQIIGEYEELLAKKSLELVVTPPNTIITTMADVRHLWRVIDNLMTNINKYSQENTRVYVSLHSPVYETNHAYLIFKNVSKAPLNITSDELMERFTRGDSSRNTEGSGLGLSIAKSLTELQGGVFTLDIDGDLFKAILRFDVLEQITENNNE